RAGAQLYARWQCAVEGSEIVRAFERERSLFDAAGLSILVGVEGDDLGLGGSRAIKVHTRHVHLLDEPGLTRRNGEIIRGSGRIHLRATFRKHNPPVRGALIPEYGRRARKRAARGQ